MAGGGLQFPKNSKLSPHGLVLGGADPGKLKPQPVTLPFEPRLKN